MREGGQRVTSNRRRYGAAAASMAAVEAMAADLELGPRPRPPRPPRPPDPCGRLTHHREWSKPPMCANVITATVAKACKVSLPCF